jgi:UDP-glucose 4-epimerase
MILVTGGAGYIGSHTIVELLNKNFEVLVIDNFSNSDVSALESIEKITGKSISFIEMDLRNYDLLVEKTKEFDIEGIIHFAAYKSVGESVFEPLKYYDNNINSLVNVLQLLKERNISNFVFSSSCTVYGSPEVIPVTEDSEVKKGESPYGKSKIIGEEIVNDFNYTHPFSAINLRYFNPIGAHSSGLIGDRPIGKPNNLLPFVTQVAIGKREVLSVFGDDYDTPDGTCLRDYIHVIDLAKAHVSAVEYNRGNHNTVIPINLGTGNGSSVLEIINTFEKVSKIKINYKINPRRKGDVPAIFGDCSLSKKLLDWEAQLSLEDMLSSAWNFEQNLKK